MLKKIVLYTFLVLSITSCGSSTQYTSSKVQTKPTNTKTEEQNIATIADKIIWSAFKYKGVPYKYGGITKAGMDCSGLIMVSFKERGISLPRTSIGMSAEGYKIRLNEAKRGDLLFFKTNPRKPNRITHVGLVTHSDNGVIKFIHASSKRGVTLNTMNQRYYKEHFAFAKRVL